MDFDTILFFYVSPIVAVIICILNSTEILILLRRLKRNNSNKKRPKSSLIYILNLAISDLLVGLTVIVIKIWTYLAHYRIIKFERTAAIIHGIILYFFLRFSLAISIFSLIALTIDRLLSIRNPFRHTTVRTRNVITTLAIIWISSVGLATGFYYFSMHVLSSETSRKYRGTIFPATIIPAVVIFSFCYVFIFKAIHAQGKKFKSKQLDESDKLRQVSFLMHILRREARVTKFVWSVILTFTLCWLPLAVLGILETNGKLAPAEVGNTIFNLAFINSAANPLIYFGFKKHFESKWKQFINPFFRR